MKKKKLIFLAFAAIIILIPIYVVVNSQDVLSNGTFYKFKPRAYDPFDPFRGKFLRLNYDREVPTSDDFEKGDDAYVSIGVDEEGFAFFEEAFKKAPKKGDYLSVKIEYVEGMEQVRSGVFGRRNNAVVDDDRGNYLMMVGIDIPDNMCKYFINEDYALAGETAFRKEIANAYIGVRIKDGECRVEDIYLKDMPIMEYLKK